jgi:recombination protein RecT
MSREIQVNESKQTPNILTILDSPKAAEELARIAGGTIDAAQFAKIALTTIKSKWGDLRDCDPFSIFTAVLEAAQLNLDTSVAANEFYFVPMKSTCVGMLGYRGMIRLAYRSGVAKKVDAKARYAGDEFEFEETQDGPRWRHVPYWQMGRDRGALLFTYAYARLANDEIIFKVADQYRIKTAKDASRAKGTWDKHPDAMATKTSMRELWKFLPKDRIDPRVAFALDDDAARDEDGTVVGRVSSAWAPALFGQPPTSVGELIAAPGLEPDAKPRRSTHARDPRDGDDRYDPPADEVTPS